MVAVVTKPKQYWWEGAPTTTSADSLVATPIALLAMWRSFVTPAYPNAKQRVNKPKSAPKHSQCVHTVRQNVAKGGKGFVSRTWRSSC
jgi:hypothetical protein